MLIGWIIAGAIFVGYILDILFADPSFILHPVVIIGKYISFLEKKLRKVFPETDDGKLKAGRLLVVIVTITTFLVTSAILLTAWFIHPGVFIAIQIIWCWQALSTRGLAMEAQNISNCLSGREIDKRIPGFDISDLPKDENGRLLAGRRAVSRVVGRDTKDLTEEQIIKATIETVAENFSDGVVAPMFYMTIGGAVLAMVYKSINTMDSMLGYKNEKYLYFGRFAAKLDDVANYIPSRIAALFFIVASGLAGFDYKHSFKIWRRDRRNHASPNSAQTESACAGALNIRLAGPAYYFGEYYDKPYIGDAIKPIRARHIDQTNRIMYFGSALALVVFEIIHAVIMLLIF